MIRTLLAALVGVLGLLVTLFFFTSRQATAPNSLSTTTPASTVVTASTTVSTARQATETLVPQTVTFAGGRVLTFNIPQHYTISIAAQGLRHARFMAWSPDHRLFVGEMTNAGDTTTGRVLILSDFNSLTGTFQSVHTYLDNQRNPNSVAFYTDPLGNVWLYVALTNELIRYPYHDGDLAPSGPGQVIATFPDTGKLASEGGWHLTRTVAFNGNDLYVSVGSSCNSCEETQLIRAVILKMNADGSNSKVYASGLRNAVGITWVKDALYATVNEVDQLGNDKPNDLVYKVQSGANYGWPYCYEYNGVVYPDTTSTWQHPISCSTVPLAWTELPPHSAPLGITYVGQSFADPALRNAFLVALHGSGNVAIGTGNEVAIVRQGTVSPFMTGFLQRGVRVARPVDALLDGDQSLFLSDDFNGAIYYLRYQP